MNFNLIHFPNFKKTFFGTAFKTDILGVLERVRDEIGCRHIIHCYRQRPGDQPRNGVSDLTVVITVPSSWAARYSEKNYIAIDPIFQEGNPYFSPGVSGLVQDLAEEAIDNADVTKMLQDAQKHGLGTLFVAVTARHPSGMLGCSVFIFNTEGQDNKAFITKMRAKLLSVSGSIHNTLCAGNEPTSPSSLLTPREIDCLRWAASGKTDGEIGEILSIARWTVVTYLQNAKIKLGCSNRTSAVATALALGIIDMPAVQHLT